MSLKENSKEITDSLYKRLLSSVNGISINNLSWKNPLASQVISDESEIVRKLPGNLKKGFMVKNYIFGYALLLTLFNDIQFALETCS